MSTENTTIIGIFTYKCNFFVCLYIIEVVKIISHVFQSFLLLLTDYYDIFKVLRTYRMFTQSDADDLQSRIDSFMREYWIVFGDVEVTNYLHDLQAGHFHYFLTKYNNLYVHANIGLEASIGTTTSYIHRGTQHGGHYGAGHEKFSTVQAMKNRLVNKVAYSLGKLTGNAPQFVQKLVA